MSPDDDPLIVRAARGQDVRRPPVWFMRQAGSHFAEHQEIYQEHGVRGITSNPGRNTKVSLLPVEILDVDAAVMYADIILPLEDMGISFHYGEGETGPIIHNPIERPGDVEKLRVLDPERGVPYILESIRRVREALAPEKGLIGFSGGPFTLAGYMIEGGASRTFPVTKRFMHTYPDAFGRLMDRLAESIIRYLKQQVQSGIDLIQIFDSWIGVLAPSDFRRWVLPTLKKIFRSLETTDTPRILFGTDIAGLLPDYLSVDAEVHSVDWRIDLQKLRKQFGDQYVIQGNLDPSRLFSPKQSLKNTTQRMLEAMKPFRGQIANLGHRIPLNVDVDALKTVVSTVKNFSYE